MNRQEEFFGTCTSCHKKKLIVFDCSWKGQTSPTSKRWVKKGKFWLCYPCTKGYMQLPDNYEYDLKAKEMCEVLDGK